MTAISHTLPLVSKTAGSTPPLDLQTIIDALPCFISIQDRNLRVLYANKPFREAFGEPDGSQCHLLYKKVTDRCPKCPAQQTFQDRRVHSGEETVRLKDGQISHLLMHTVPIVGVQEEVGGIIEMAVDITGVKKAQKELATLGQSIAFLSHGIKNILEGLQGGAYVVDEGLTDGDVELSRKGWAIVKKNIFDITDAVQNILYSSKQRELRYQSVPPGKLAEQAIELFRQNALAMGVRLNCEIDPELPEARLDPASIRRMLNNLIWNGIEACQKQGEKPEYTVSVRTARCDAEHFMFEIEDDGPGMEPGVVRNIFEEFFSTKGSSGTGLGLAVVDKIVNQHGGRIEVESHPGKGSRFRIFLKL